MRYISADRIFDGSGFLTKGSIIVLDEKNHFAGLVDEHKIDPLNLEKFEGDLTPGNVNAHCHLELSHLKNCIPEQTGLAEFAKNIIIKRNNFTAEQINSAADEADAFMKQSGIAAVGDISNTAASFRTKLNSSIHYHTFIELIGLNPEKKASILNAGIQLLNELQNASLIGSLAPHAPYSTSAGLIEAISDYNLKNKLPLSIHNQESAEENKFLQGKESEFFKLFRFLNIDISWFKPSFRSSLDAYASLLKNTKNILVHNTYTSEADFQSVNSNVFWCLCPSANLYIENTLPDFDLLLKNTRQICFGTDSLASNSDLDIVKEASIFYSETKNLELSLKGLTSAGAEALNLQDSFGKFIIGKNTGLNLLEVKTDRLLLKKVIVFAGQSSTKP